MILDNVFHSTLMIKAMQCKQCLKYDKYITFYVRIVSFKKQTKLCELFFHHTDHSIRITYTNKNKENAKSNISVILLCKYYVLQLTLTCCCEFFF